MDAVLELRKFILHVVVQVKSVSLVVRVNVKSREKPAHCHARDTTTRRTTSLAGCMPDLALIPWRARCAARACKWRLRTKIQNPSHFGNVIARSINVNIKFFLGILPLIYVKLQNDDLQRLTQDQLTSNVCIIDQDRIHILLTLNVDWTGKAPKNIGRKNKHSNGRFIVNYQAGAVLCTLVHTTWHSK